MLDALEVYEPSLVNEDRTQATTSGQPRRRLAPASEGKAAPCCPETVPSPKPNGPALSKCAWRPASSVVVPREKHRATAPEWVPVAARPRRHRTGRRAWTPCIQVLVLLHRTKYHRHVSHQRHIARQYNRMSLVFDSKPSEEGIAPRPTEVGTLPRDRGSLLPLFGSRRSGTSIELAPRRGPRTASYRSWDAAVRLLQMHPGTLL